MIEHDVKDLNLATAGRYKIEWAESQMPVLQLIRERFSKERPLAGLKISACLHVTSETAALARTMQVGGADLVLCASNPLSTQDEVAASLVANDEIPVYAIKGEDNETYYRHLNAALDHHPHMTMDDGCDLVSVLHKERKNQISEVLAGTEETTTGVIRLRAMAKEKVLRYPVLAVNDSMTKHFFDNRYGTGQSTVDGIVRATNILLAGRTFVVCGYGWCGRGLASRARGMGAQVVVTEVDPLKALEALMDGFQVLPLSEASSHGDIFVTVTGDKNVIDASHMQAMKDGAVLANSGHFNSEINIPALESMSKGEPRQIRPFVQQYTLENGRHLNLLGEGRLINLAAAEGHPAAVMDMSFANQALGLEFMRANAKTLENDVYTIPEAIDREIARLKLDSMGVKIDTLTSEQAAYLASWQEGT